MKRLLLNKNNLFLFLGAFIFALALSVTVSRGRQTFVSGSTGVGSRQIDPVVPVAKTLGFQISSEATSPAIFSREALIVDLETLKPVFAKEATVSAEIASTTKITTALIAQNKWLVGDLLTVPTACVNLVGSNVGLIAGETLRFDDILRAMLINSAADAACTLYINGGGMPAFVAEMNNLVKSLNLKSVYFGNPIGFDGVGDWVGNTASAVDLAVLTKEALKNDLFREIVGTKEKTITSFDGSLTHNLVNTNRLLGTVPEVYGVKTGQTDGAGQCLVTALKVKDRDFLIIILGSSDRFGETIRLIDWLKTNVSWD